MDLFDLLILALFALPVLLRWIEQSRKKGKGVEGLGGREVGERPSAPITDFESALREIRIALGGGAIVPEAPTPTEQPVVDGAFAREERFEQPKPVGASIPSSASVPFRALRRSRIDSSYTRRRSSIPKKARKVRKRLRTSSQAREAVLLSEILQPPLALRRRR